jgi:hypothetical protein
MLRPTIAVIKMTPVELIISQPNVIFVQMSKNWETY